MRSASTSMASSSSELSKIAQAKAIQGQPTQAARVQARPVMASPEPVKAARVEAVRVEAPVRIEAPVQQSPKFARVVARPIMGQAPAAAAAAAQTTLTRDEATVILQGLTETLRLSDNARTTGWRCTGVDDATFYKGRVLRDRLANYLGFPDPSGAGFAITKDEADVADKILGCSNEATGVSSDKTAWIVLGVIVVGAAVFFSVTARSK